VESHGNFWKPGMPKNLDGYEALRLLWAFFVGASFAPESLRMSGVGGSSPPISTKFKALITLFSAAFLHEVGYAIARCRLTEDQAFAFTITACAPVTANLCAGTADNALGEFARSSSQAACAQRVSSSRGIACEGASQIPSGLPCKARCKRVPD